jgi:hypothetical protein
MFVSTSNNVALTMDTESCKLTTPTIDHDSAMKERILRYVSDNVVPYHQIDAADAVQMVSILVSTGLVDLQNRPDFRFAFEVHFGVDCSTKRLNWVILGTARKPPWTMKSDCIRHFEMLTYLDFFRCAWLSKPAIESILGLPNLAQLGIWYMPKDSITSFLNCLRNIEAACPFRQNLKEIKIHECDLDEDHLETLLFDILPRFPNLTSIRVDRNKIQSLKKISHRLKTTSNLKISSRLRYLQLTDNPVWRKIVNDPEEIAAVKLILRKYKGLSSLSHLVCALGHPSKDVELNLLLQINHAGRALVEGGVDAVDMACGYRRRPLPLSVWPIVLARTHNGYDTYFPPLHVESDVATTKLYYLLRHGPALSPEVFENRRRESKESQRQQIVS